MRIDRLLLTNFRNLVNFEVDFDVTSTRQVVVGRNGVGKSNLLEALTWIFRDLDLEEDSHFGYEIEYHCNMHYVKIVSSQTNVEDCKNNPNVAAKFSREYWIAPEVQLVDQEISGLRTYQQLSESEFFRRNRAIKQQPNPDRILPLYVFGYYSGVI